ncbi:MAG: hypothetical protein N3A59_03435 [Thermodesulfovibrionales bacterium]|nr:hypothetical protein [Thermodesulfovibrionales bacterium]
MIKKQTMGFTLIEILIALTLTSFIIVTLYNTFFLIHKGINAVDDSLLRLQEARIAIDTLKKELESAFYMKEKDYTIFKIEDRDFYGRGTSKITFTTFSPLIKGLAKISYIVSEENGKLTLRKKIDSAFHGDLNKSDFELIEHLQSFILEVRYKDRWLKTWDSNLSGIIPDEVRITINIPEKIADPSEGQKRIISLIEIAKPMIGKNL